MAPAKTLTGLRFLLEGASCGEAGLLVGFRETPRQLVDKARSFGMDLQRAIDDGRIVIIHRAPVGLLVDEVTWELRRRLQEFAPARLVVDSLTDLEIAVIDRRRLGEYVVALVGMLRNRRVTALITKEVAQLIGPELDFSDTPLAAIAQNLVLFRQVEYRGDLFRIVSILKMQDSTYDTSIRQYEVTNTGLHVLGRIESAEGLLTGIARLPSEAHRKPAGR